jgi:hypothetical protein
MQLLVALLFTAETVNYAALFLFKEIGVWPQFAEAPEDLASITQGLQ